MHAPVSVGSWAVGTEAGASHRAAGQLEVLLCPGRAPHGGGCQREPLHFLPRPLLQLHSERPLSAPYLPRIQAASNVCMPRRHLAHYACRLFRLECIGTMPPCSGCQHSMMSGSLPLCCLKACYCHIFASTECVLVGAPAASGGKPRAFRVPVLKGSAWDRA